MAALLLPPPPDCAGGDFIADAEIPLADILSCRKVLLSRLLKTVGASVALKRDHMPVKPNAKQRRPDSPRIAENALYFSERLRKKMAVILKNPLTVVEAPMGYGKTVAVKNFLANIPADTVVTTVMETSPESFWRDFCDALSRCVPKAKDICAALFRLGFPHDFSQTAAAMELLRQIPFVRKTFLVFDDCHLLPRSFIDFCECMAGENLPNLHIVYVTRDAWADNRELLRPLQTFSCIDRHTFTLTPPEIREYCALYGISLCPDEERELCEKTGGWISALRLALLWYKKHGEFSFFPADIAVRIRDTVYEPLSAEAKELLFAVAPLERFTAFQASRLYGRDAGPILTELTRKNSFVAYDPKSHFYSPHAIFRQFLLVLFNDDAAVAPGRRRSVYKACGDVLRDAGELASAAQAWHKAGDFESVLAALEKDMRRNLVTERAGLYVTMFKDCPDEILERHIGASFKYAIAAMSAGDYPAFGARTAWLAKRCAALPPGKESDRWRGELHVLLSLAEFNDIRAMSGHQKKALALLGGPTSLYGPDSPWTLGCPSVLFMFHRESAKLADELALMHKCMPYYYQLAAHHGAGGEFLMEAEAIYNAGDCEKAREMCQTGMERAVRHNQIGNVFCALFLQMRLALLAGDVDALFGREGKHGFGSDMRALISQGRDYFLLHTAELCEGWLYAALGLHDKIPHWLRSPLAAESPLYAYAKGYYYIVHGRALLLAGQYGETIELFSDLIETAAFPKNLLSAVYSRIYLAAALQKTGRSREAVDALKSALDAALSDKLYIPFAENYDVIGPLAENVLSGREHAQALPRITALAKRLDAGRELILAAIQDPAQRFKLTRREFDVARLAAERLTVQEIAAQLCLSVNTVKTHLKAVYQKTGASSRPSLKKLLQ